MKNLSIVKITSGNYAALINGKHFASVARITSRKWIIINHIGHVHLCPIFSSCKSFLEAYYCD